MGTPTCTRCGAPITAGADFCGQCGAVLEITQASPPPPPQSSVAARTAQSPIPLPRRGFPILPLLVLGVGVLAVAAALLLVPRWEPPAGETLLGQAGHTPTPAVDGGLPPPAVPPSAVTMLIEPTQTFGAGGGSGQSTLQPEISPTEPPPPTRTPTPPLVAIFEARKAAKFDVSPDDAEVAVNGRVIGKADDWDDSGGGKLYEFDGPGSYFVKLSLKGYRTAWIKIVISEDAGEKVAEVDTELKEDGVKGEEKVDKKDKKSKKDKKDKDEKDEKEQDKDEET